ncbi:type IV pilin [Haloprofundus sp. MHR1]|uniref:type IV pilin n=1 Tax=Haloprofundus sp. MHR1 TaxID=2572921 RepID=UPI0010BE2404|nr:type IV pilin N-terminal domain-containing protein [Haloprofundus sp. MHR1]QCJ45957.1 type IV pilin [Haloprofundus sp. MHR1]
MKFPNPFGNENRAVSPVIGVILMVAITVILAAVIGTFVLGLGDNIQTAPQASFGFDYDEDEAGGAGTVTITHRGGDTFDAGEIEVRKNGNDVTDPYSQIVRTGSTAKVDVNGGDSISVVYVGGDGESVVGSYEVPE